MRLSSTAPTFSASFDSNLFFSFPVRACVSMSPSKESCAVLFTSSGEAPSSLFKLPSEPALVGGSSMKELCNAELMPLTHLVIEPLLRLVLVLVAVAPFFA